MFSECFVTILTLLTTVVPALTHIEKHDLDLYHQQADLADWDDFMLTKCKS